VNEPQLHSGALLDVVATASGSVAIATDSGLQHAHKVIRKHPRYAGGLQGALPPAAGHLLDPMDDGTFLEIQLVRLLGRVLIFDYCTD